MSAFDDIWIGQGNPITHRGDNKNWFQKDGYWYSTPRTNKIWAQEVESDTHLMIVLGQFYEKVDVKKLLKECAEYATGSSSSFNDPAGHYIIFLIHKVSGGKYVFTNRFGTYHAYWSTAENAKAISTYYMGLAKQVPDKKLDWEGLSGFLAMGFFPEDKTYLEAIKIFSPASCYVFDKDLCLLEKKCYWNWTFNTSYTQHTADEIKHTLAESIGYATAGCRVAIPVSGGLDSRMLAGAIGELPAASYKSAWSFSYGYTTSSPEIRIAEKISKTLGFPFHKKVVPDYLFGKMKDIIDSVELFQYVDGTRQACMLGELRNDADIVIGGHWGDVWMNDTHLEAGDTDSVLSNFFAKKVVKKGSKWLLDEVCKNHISKSEDYLSDYFKTSLDKYSHLDDVQMIAKAYKTDQWSFRWTLASIRMYQAAVLPVLPFYDKRIAELLMPIPSAMLKGRQFQVEYIKKNYPSLAAISWQEYAANLYSYKYVNNRNYLYRAVSKASRLINGAPPIRNWEVFYLNDTGRDNLTKALCTPRMTDIVPEQKIEALLADFYSRPTAENGYTISMLHTLSQFLTKLDE